MTSVNGPKVAYDLPWAPDVLTRFIPRATGFAYQPETETFWMAHIDVAANKISVSTVSIMRPLRTIAIAGCEVDRKCTWQEFAFLSNGRAVMLFPTVCEDFEFLNDEAVVDRENTHLALMENDYRELRVLQLVNLRDCVSESGLRAASLRHLLVSPSEQRIRVCNRTEGQSEVELNYDLRVMHLRVHSAKKNKRPTRCFLGSCTDGLIIEGDVHKQQQDATFTLALSLSSPVPSSEPDVAYDQLWSQATSLPYSRQVINSCRVVKTLYPDEGGVLVIMEDNGRWILWQCMGRRELPTTIDLRVGQRPYKGAVVWSLSPVPGIVFVVWLTMRDEKTMQRSFSASYLRPIIWSRDIHRWLPATFRREARALALLRLRRLCEATVGALPNELFEHVIAQLAITATTLRG